MLTKDEYVAQVFALLDDEGAHDLHPESKLEALEDIRRDLNERIDNLENEIVEEAQEDASLAQAAQENLSWLD